MLYDPKWEAKTKPDVFALENLIAWLEKQPAASSYCYEDTGGCLLHRYFTAMGFKVACVGGHGIDLAGHGYVSLSDAFQDIPVIHPHTYGAALERARSVSSAHRGTP